MDVPVSDLGIKGFVMTTTACLSNRDLTYMARTIFAQQYPYRPNAIFYPWRDELTLLMEKNIVQLQGVLHYSLTTQWKPIVFPDFDRDTMMDTLKPLFRTRDETRVAPTGDLLLKLESLERQGSVHVRRVEEKWDVFELSPEWRRILFPDIGDRRDVLKCVRKYFQSPTDLISLRDEAPRMNEDLRRLYFASVIEMVDEENPSEYRLTSEWRRQLAFSS
jgi:hypothetical protein